MKRLIAFGLVALSLSACNSESDSGKKDGQDSLTAKSDTSMAILTEQEKSDGWQLLFDGKTMNGWHKYGGGPVGKAWQIADQTLYLDTSNKKDWQVSEGGDIVTDESFENFDFKVDWKIARNGNSGIMFYIQDDSARFKYPWYTGPEMQVLDNEGHPDAKIPKHRAGDLYDLISSSKETVKPAGEWNQAEIKCVNGKLDLFLNGENVVSTTLWDDNWKKLVAGSKFKEWAEFGTFKNGHIGLQDHGNAVWFRNIRIKKL